MDPAGAVVTKVRPAGTVADIRAEICDLGNFFSSAEAAGDWLNRNPQGGIDTVTTEFAITWRVMSEFGWVSTR